MPAVWNNHTFTDATAISDGVPCTGITDNPNYNAWFTWTAATDGQVGVDTRGSDFDTVLNIYVIPSGMPRTQDSLTWVTWDDDSGGNRTSLCVFTATAGLVYYFVVNGYHAATGNYVLNYPIGAAPTPTSTGGSGGSGTGNMLGGLIVGDTMLGADPGSDAGGGGSGGGGLGNLLGGYLLGDPILGGDPGSGAGGDIGISGNTWTLSGHIVNRTTVTGDLSRITAFIQGRTVLARTTVTGRLSLAEPLGAAISTRTAVTGNLFNPVALTAAEAGATTVTGDATRSIMHGQIHASTAVSAALQLIVESIRPQTVRGLTAVTGRIALAGDYSATVDGATVVTGNAIKPFGIIGELILGATTVHGEASRHILRGAITAATALSARLSLRGQATVTVTCATIVRGALSTSYSLYAAVADATSARARLHVYPVDFQDIVIRARSAVTGAIRLKSVLGVTIDGATDVAGWSSGRFLLIPRTITGATTVRGHVPTSFGADLDLRTSINARLGVFTMANTWRGERITCVTVVTGTSPDTSLRGHIGGPYYYWPTPITGDLHLVARLWPMPVNGMTALHSHFRGHWPHDGPLGSVTMTALPAGDMGVPNEVNGSSTVGADVTVERSRILTLVGNAGLAVERDLVLPATAAGGTGTRNAAVPWDVEEPVLTHRTLYV